MSHFLYVINTGLRKIHIQSDQFRILSPVIYKNELDRISLMWSYSFLKDFKSYIAHTQINILKFKMISSEIDLYHNYYLSNFLFSRCYRFLVFKLMLCFLNHLPLSLHIDHLCHSVIVVIGCMCHDYLSFSLLLGIWIVPSLPLF